MGRTLPTTTDLLRQEIEECKPFRNAFPKKERKEFDMMLQRSQLYRYATMMSLPQHPVRFRLIMMSAIFRQYPQLLEVKKELEGRK